MNRILAVLTLALGLLALGYPEPQQYPPPDDKSVGVTPEPTPAPPSCPCSDVGNLAPTLADTRFAMTTSAIEALIATAQSNGCTGFTYTCPSNFSLAIFCNAPTFESIAYFEAPQSTNCNLSTGAGTYVPGSPVSYTGSAAVAYPSADWDACAAAITNVSTYPGYCPTP